MKSKKWLFLILFLAALLRLWGLDRVPVSLFSDELDVGYQAYSILKTGKDYFGNPSPLHFQSYVEYRAPMYIYSTVPTVAIFGITPFGIRLPAALFGIAGVLTMYWFVKELSKDDSLSLLSALLLALSPWHIHYSRAAFEVSELVFLLLIALYFFLRSLKNPELLWLSALFIGLTPWTYSTAKLFTPALIIFLSLVWFKDLIKMPTKHLKRAALILLLLGLPLLYVISFGGGAQRFSQISVLGDSTVQSQADSASLDDARFRITHGGGLPLQIASYLVNNKLNLWVSSITANYLQSFSTHFLFLNGDISHRHSVDGYGQFYRFDAIFLLAGIILFVGSKYNRKLKILILFWIFFGAVPSALTIEGGGHATRLILILPPLIFLIAFAFTDTRCRFKNRFHQKLFVLGYFALLLTSQFFFQYNYWLRYPWISEKSWHAGYGDAIVAAKAYEDQYGKIVITNAEERPYVFFAAYYKYDPALWQQGFELGFVPGFGELNKIGKYHFGQVEGTLGMDKLSQAMDEDTLYVAAKREIAPNLITEPQKIPQGLHLVKAIALPSGEPAFYLLEKD